jgi:outer membrane lipoprotein-sorting protein
MTGVRRRLPLRLPRSPAALLAAVALLAITFLTGCGTPAAGTPSQIMKKAIAAQGRLKSVRIDLNTDMEIAAPGDNRSNSISYKGSYEKPDRWKLTVRSAGTRAEIIIIGDRTWMKSRDSTGWVEKTTSAKAEGAAPGDVVASTYLKSARNIELVDQKDDMYHLRFDLNLLDFARAHNISGLDPSLFKGKEAQMEVWVRQKDLYLDSAKMEFAAHFAAPLNTDVKMSNEIEFSNFNEPVSIEPPN